MFSTIHPISLKDAVEQSLKDGDASSLITYQIERAPGVVVVDLNSNSSSQSLVDQENLQQPHLERDKLYVNIEARNMKYFKEPVTAIFIRDVSKEVANF